MHTNTATTRDERKARTREGLKRAARQCFSREGYRATQIGDIARAAGVAQGTMYVHFPSKEAVLEELLSELDQELKGALDSAWEAAASDPDSSSVETRVRGVALACLRTWHLHRDLLRAFAERAALGLDIDRLRRGVSPSAARWLHQRLGETSALLGSEVPHTDLVAQGILGLWMRIGLASLDDHAPPLSELADLLTRLSLGALAGVVTRSAPPKTKAAKAPPRSRRHEPPPKKR